MYAYVRVCVGVRFVSVGNDTLVGTYTYIFIDWIRA